MSDYSSPVDWSQVDAHKKKRRKLQKQTVGVALKMMGIESMQPQPYRTAKRVGNEIQFTYAPENGKKYTFSHVHINVNDRQKDTTIAWGGDKDFITTREGNAPGILLSINTNTYIMELEVFNARKCKELGRLDRKGDRVRGNPIGMAFVIIIALCFQCNTVTTIDWTRYHRGIRRGKTGDCSHYEKLAGFKQAPSHEERNIQRCTLENVDKKYSLEDDVVQKITERMRGMEGGAGGASKY